MSGDEVVKRHIKWILIPVALILSPVIILVEVFIVIFIIGSISNWHASLEWEAIQNEITTYVLENKDSIEIDTLYGYQHFEYTYTGFWDASVEFGYYYSENDTHNGNPTEDERYKNGYRIDGIDGDPVDWYYSEKICDHWYYYELHDG